MSSVDLPQLSPCPPRRRGQTLLAWLAILGVVAFLFVRQHSRPMEEEIAARIGMQAQSRYLVGAASLKLPGVSGPQIYQQAARTANQGSFRQRLQFAIVAGELQGPTEASRLLRELESQPGSGSEETRDLVHLLRPLYVSYEKGETEPSVLDDQAQQKLRDRLGWFGELALAPEGGDPASREHVLSSARRTVIAYFVVAVGFFFGITSGVILLAILTGLFFAGRLHGGLSCGTGHGGIYAETFALYMVVYIGLGYLASFLPAGQWRFALSGVVMLLSLVVLAWPLGRGLSWQQVKEDLGLSSGKHPLIEVLVGVGCYLSALPVLALGVLIMFALMYARNRLGWGGDPLKPGNTPGHPIAGAALQGNWLVWVQLFVIAAILAPLVEEIMFRGVLYRHLREISHRASAVMGTLFSVLVSSFVFAVIHPQGWLGVPVLMALATIFALTREWRGSLLAPMVAHGINNGTTLCLLLLIAG